MIIAIKVWLIVWMWCYLDPIQDTLQSICRWFITKTKINRWFLDKLYTLSGCHACLSFWGILIMTLNPFYAIIGYIFAYWTTILHEYLTR